MKIDNKTTHFLNGPFIFFGFGFVVAFLSGLLLKKWGLAGIGFIFSWFVFGTFSGTEIDTEKRLYRSYNNYFGFLRLGKWRSIDDFIGVTLVPMKKVYKMYSRSNRINKSSQKDYRIYFVNTHKKPSVLIKKCKTKEKAQQSIDEFAIWLKLPVFSAKSH